MGAAEGRNEDDYRPEMPPLHCGEYLIGYLYEIGPKIADGPITFTEIDRWCNRVGIDLLPWESRTLRRLSIEYLNEQGKATSRDRQAPWRPDGAKPEVTAAQAALRALANQ